MSGRADLAPVGRAVASLLVVLVAVIAGAVVFPRTVVRTRAVVDRRPLISNGATAAAVRANFFGRPRGHAASPIVGFECVTYGSAFAVVDAGGPAFILELCTRGLPA